MFSCTPHLCNQVTQQICLDSVQQFRRRLHNIINIDKQTEACFIKSMEIKMKKVNKQCLLDTPRTVRVSEKTCQVIV